MYSYVKSLFIILVLTLTSILFSQFAGGDGSPGDPYQVADADGLYCVRFEPFANYVQVADIDLSTSMWSEVNMISWEPIGTDIGQFTGVYDGNGFIIDHLYINSPTLINMGLFGYLEGATLQNVVILDADIVSGSCTGALAGYSSMSSSITNCSTSGTIQGENETGGLVGINSRSTISNSYSTCNVQGVMPIGGLIGVNDNSTVTDCFARGSVNGEDMVGGFSGYNGMSNISNCYSTGTVTAIMPTYGGLIGYEDGSNILESYWDIETSGCVSSAAGIGLPTIIMKDQMTYMNWDFITPIWSIDSLNSGYPYLSWSIPQETVNPFAGGNGTELDPYQVETAIQLNNVRNNLDSYFIQIADIDLGVSPWNEGEGWVPIGVMEPEKEFIGSYNGDYHTISNLFIDNQDSYYENTGLFGFCYGDINNSTIENVILDSVNITGFTSVGALVGYLMGGNILNCSSSGTINGEETVGGLIGHTEYYTIISSCYSTCSVTATNNFLFGDFMGGLIGDADDCNISDSYASGTIIGGHCVGGLIGNYTGNPMTANCYSTGSITGEFGYTGGLIGYGDSANESYSYWDMDTSGQDTSFVGSGKTYSEMHNQITYETWDFTTVWDIDPQLNYGYPYLTWSTPPVNNTAFAGGDGTEENPYLIATPTQLDSVRNHLNASFMQVVDIDLEEYLSIGFPGYNNGEFWQPIGVDWERFEGIYDGNKKEIRNLKINSYDSNTGLFSTTEVGSEIKYLSITNPDSICIYGTDWTGGLVGYNFGNISNCFSNCNVSGFSGMGGLVGNNSGIILQSYSTGNIIARDLEMFADGAGGLVGHNAGEIINCYARGKVTAKSYVGGLAGSNSNIIRFSYSSGKVIGETYTGGLVGSGMGEESYWDIETSVQPDPEEFMGRTHAEMLDQSTYDYSWDFTTPIWMMDTEKNSGYPYLAWSDPVEPIISFEDGDGSQSNPYQVATAEQLNEVRNHLDSYFIQVADIDLGVGPWNTGEGWLPIGDSMVPFIGQYIGDGYDIIGLTINRPLYFDSVGLFGHIEDADIIAVDMLNAYIYHSFDNTGIITGSAINNSYIASCSSIGEISSSAYTGGISGALINSRIEACYSVSDLNANGYNAGIITGYASNSDIINCYARGKVSAKDYSGGITGYSSNTDFSYCYSTAEVLCTDSTYFGGLTGYNSAGTFTSSYWDIQTSGQTTSPIGEGKYTSEMKDQANFLGWDFTYDWEIYPTLNNGYPYLKWEGLIKLPLFAGGDGSEGNPYQITNVFELQNMNIYLDAHYIIMNDFNAAETYEWNNNQGFNPIGYNLSAFIGNLDGQNFTIDSLYINRPEGDYIGLISFTGTNCNITQVNISNSNIIGNQSVGTLIGDANYSTISKCSSNGSTSGTVAVGGLIGQCDLSTVTFSNSSGTVNADFNGGGFSATNFQSTINNCFSNAIVTADSAQAGGFVGWSNSPYFEKCYSTGNVNSPQNAGGFVGQNYICEIRDCFSTGSVTGNTRAGGFIGYNWMGLPTNCYSTGIVSGITQSGGFCGFNEDGLVTSSYWDTETSGNSTSDGGEGKTTSEMKTQTTFIDWNFNTTWNIVASTNNGYPYLIEPVGTPENISIHDAGNEIILYWDDVPGATSYKIFGSDNPYGNFSDITESGFILGLAWYTTNPISKMFFYVVAIREDKAQTGFKLKSNNDIR